MILYDVQISLPVHDYPEKALQVRKVEGLYITPFQSDQIIFYPLSMQYSD